MKRKLLLAGISCVRLFRNQHASGFSHWQILPSRHDALVMAAVRRWRCCS
jgi:hypothetical protein